ncbi:MAG: hypothetical protein V5B44_11210 [Candidatus Accumulibacter necessarius]|uniref:hypothetical protein n=1 Tax=Candidatus Accumulibacter necessarius TaxID=2954386 RepID=UPI002FC3260F
MAPGPERTRINGLIIAMESALAVGEQQGAIDLGIWRRDAQPDGQLPRPQRGLRTGAGADDHGQSAGDPLCRLVRVLSAFARHHAVPARHPAGQHSRLPQIKAMGFDVVYLPPIHPIGHSFRKGKNNSLVAVPGDVGSPWAIGNEHGGHMALEPQLGTWE